MPPPPKAPPLPPPFLQQKLWSLWVYVCTLISFAYVCLSSVVESRIVSVTSLDSSSFHYHSDAQGNGSEIDVVDGKEVICGGVKMFECLSRKVR